MRKTWARLLLAAGISVNATASAEAPESIKEQLWLWEPKAVVLEQGVLTIITREDQVNQETYGAVIRAVCTSLWLNEDAWSGVDEMIVLNRHAHRGYVFVGGEAECVEMGELNSEDTNRYLTDKTHLH